MLQNNCGRSSIATHKETETTILQLLKSFEIRRRELGYGKTIFELRADKGSVDLGTQEQGETVTIDTNVVEETHDLENSRGTRGNNG